MGTPGREPTVSDEDILEVFRQATDPVVTTKEVSEAINLGRRGTLDRLKSLEDDNQIRKKRIGEKAIVWWDPQTLQDRYSEE